MSPRVDVLMSTYNGSPAHLDEQINSILSQRAAEIRLVVRDDGSNDPAFLARLRHWEQCDAIRVGYGANIGVFASFLTLLAGSDASADFFAFSDQDDRWLPNKIARAVAQLERLPEDEQPLLYCSRQIVADTAMKARGATPAWPRTPHWRNALVENIATGCTIVMNRAARALLSQTPLAPTLIYHDWWCYLVVSAFGTVIFDPEPAIVYRQHGDNVVGVGQSPPIRLFRKLKRARSGHMLDYARMQARHFLACHGDRLSAEQHAATACLTERRGIGAGLSREVWRQFPLDNLFLRLMLAS